MSSGGSRLIPLEQNWCGGYGKSGNIPLSDRLIQTTGGLTARDVEGFLRPPSPAPARLTAPASGLFLERVFYEGDERRIPLVPAVPVPAARR